MSTFSTYAHRVDELAKAVFAEYTEAETRLKNAEAAVKKYPQHHGGVDYEYTAKSARAQADLIEARDSLHKAQMKMNDGIRAVSSIRGELAAALSDEYAADPSAVDSATMELLKSGICTAAEYSKLLNEAQAAGNRTMGRIIGKYAAIAAEEAEKQYGQSSRQANEYRAISYLGKTDPVGDLMGAFDVLAEAFRRTAGNPAMIPHWDALTAPIIERF